LYSTRRFPTILCVRWMQFTSSRLPSLRYKRVGRVLSYFSYLIKKIRKNYCKSVWRKGKITRQPELDIQFTILLRWTPSISYCSFYLFIYSSFNLILYIYLRV
jgi:hypothetical protein